MQDCSGENPSAAAIHGSCGTTKLTIGMFRDGQPQQDPALNVVLTSKPRRHSGRATPDFKYGEDVGSSGVIRQTEPGVLWASIRARSTSRRTTRASVWCSIRAFRGRIKIGVVLRGLIVSSVLQPSRPSRLKTAGLTLTDWAIRAFQPRRKPWSSRCRSNRKVRQRELIQSRPRLGIPARFRRFKRSAISTTGTRRAHIRGSPCESTMTLPPDQLPIHRGAQQNLVLQELEWDDNAPTRWQGGESPEDLVLDRRLPHGCGRRDEPVVGRGPSCGTGVLPRLLVFFFAAMAVSVESVWRVAPAMTGSDYGRESNGT